MSTKQKDPEAISIPYDSLDLRLALMSAGTRITEEPMMRIRDKIEAIIPQGKIAQNDRIAEYNGISVDSLINSPNYLTFKKEFQENMMKKCIDVMEKEGFSNKEAYALLALSLGALGDMGSP